MPAVKVLHYPAPEKPLERAEIQQIFAKFSRTDPIMIALRQMLQQHLAEATGESAEPDLTEREAGIAAGRITEISELQTEIAGFHDGADHLRKRGAVEVAKK